jgi:hypothetical protein
LAAVSRSPAGATFGPSVRDVTFGTVLKGSGLVRTSLMSRCGKRGMPERPGLLFAVPVVWPLEAAGAVDAAGSVATPFGTCALPDDCVVVGGGGDRDLATAAALFSTGARAGGSGA